jgi:hypothetical protein
MSIRRPPFLPSAIFIVGLGALLLGLAIAVYDVSSFGDLREHYKYGPYGLARFGGFFSSVGVALCCMAFLLYRFRKQ